MLNDVRYGLRALRRNAAVTVTAIVALGLGISANTAMFSLADAFLFKPLALKDPDRLVVLPETRGDEPIAGTSHVAPANFEDWKKQTTSFEGVAAFQLVSINITGQGDPEGVLGERVSSGLFELVGAQPLMGRVFRPEEDQPGRNQVAVLSFGLWERRFASDPNMIGKTVKLDGNPVTVVGIMPKNFHFPLAAEMWTPTGMDDKERAVRGSRYMDAIAKLKPGVSMRQAAAEMATIAKRLEQTYPDTNRGWHVRVMPVRDFLVGDLTHTYTWMLLAAVGFVLLIACANVANVQFARATFRTKEIAVRTALGAGRWDIIRLLLVESVLLGLAGAVGSIVLAQWDLEMIRDHMPPEIGRFVSGWDQISLDGHSLLFTALAATLAGIVGPGARAGEFTTEPERDAQGRRARIFRRAFEQPDAWCAADRRDCAGPGVAGGSGADGEGRARPDFGERKPGSAEPAHDADHVAGIEVQGIAADCGILHPRAGIAIDIAARGSGHTGDERAIREPGRLVTVHDSRASGGRRRASRGTGPDH